MSSSVGESDIDVVPPTDEEEEEEEEAEEEKEMAPKYSTPTVTRRKSRLTWAPNRQVKENVKKCAPVPFNLQECDLVEDKKEKEERSIYLARDVLLFTIALIPFNIYTGILLILALRLMDLFADKTGVTPGKDRVFLVVPIPGKTYNSQ